MQITDGNYIYKNEAAKIDFCNLYGNYYTDKEYYGDKGYEIETVFMGEGYAGNAVIITKHEWKYFEKVEG